QPFEFGNGSNAESWQNPSGAIYTDTFRDDRPQFTGMIAYDTNWHMWTITQTPGANGYKIYNDGINHFNGTGESIVNTGVREDKWNICRSKDGGAGYFYYSGDIDEMGIWNRSLTQAEVTQLYNGGAGLNYGVISLVLDLLSPDDAVTISTTSNNFLINVTDNGAGLNNVSILINGTINQTNSSGMIGLYNFSVNNLLEGFHNWSAEAYDGSDSLVESSVRTFTIDTTFPEINISYPVNGQNFPYLVNLNNITLNTTITGTNLDTCWYLYNGTNTTFSCSSGVLVSKNLTLTNQSIVTVYANNSAGNLNNSISDWTFDIFNFNDYTYDPNITESSSTTFIGNFQTGTSISSAFLEYNNTNNSASIGSLGGNRYTLSYTVISPAVGSDTNITWFFWINNVNTTSFNQTVLNINLDNCGSYSNIIAYYY
ncbi:hypothetical protein LCGC14_2732570, partial [marine sediment metagenome]